MPFRAERVFAGKAMVHIVIDAAQHSFVVTRTQVVELVANMSLDQMPNCSVAPPAASHRRKSCCDFPPPGTVAGMSISEVRAQIDQIDEQIIRLLAAR